MIITSHAPPTQTTHPLPRHPPLLCLSVSLSLRDRTLNPHATCTHPLLCCCWPVHSPTHTHICAQSPTTPRILPYPDAQDPARDSLASPQVPLTEHALRRAQQRGGALFLQHHLHHLPHHHCVIVRRWGQPCFLPLSATTTHTRAFTTLPVSCSFAACSPQAPSHSSRTSTLLQPKPT